MLTTVKSFKLNNYLDKNIKKKLDNLNFHPLEILSYYCDPQIQVGENYPYLFYLRPNILKF